MNSAAEDRLIERDDILAARAVIAGRLHRTPVIGSAFLGARAGCRVHLKLESFQKTGSFKPRGVLNKLHHLRPEETRRGVITLSAGNHAQALAWAAGGCGIAATVVMPESSVRSKIEATRQYGGEVVLTGGDLLRECTAIQEQRGLLLIHPFDDPLVIAGQGTVGLEILEDVPDADLVIVGVGGGGLISGIGTAIKTTHGSVRVIGVEPEGAAAMTASLQRGEPVRLERYDTVADGLAAPFAGRHTLRHVQQHVDEIVTVSDRDILRAMRLILERCKVVAEPAGAAPVAALLSGKIVPPRGASVVCVLSGGNVDPARLTALLGEAGNETS